MTAEPASVDHNVNPLLHLVGNGGANRIMIISLLVDDIREVLLAPFAAKRSKRSISGATPQQSVGSTTILLLQASHCSSIRREGPLYRQVGLDKSKIYQSFTSSLGIY